MAVPTGSGTQAPPPVPPPAPVPPKGLSNSSLGALVAVIVVGAVVIALLLSGVIPGFRPTPSGGGGAGPSYDVTFSESGLASGTSWTVTLGGTLESSIGATITFSEKNGTYAFSIGSVAGFQAEPDSGSITVNGAAATQPIAFTPPASGEYSVTFTESGLPSGTSWSVTLNGSSESSATTAIGFEEKNGSYPFEAGSVTGFTPAPPSGTVTVNGAAVSQSINYSPTGGGGYRTAYSQAAPVAASTAGGQGGGGWTPLFAFGLSVAQPYSNSSTPGLNASCPLTGGPTSWPTLSAWTGNYSDGKASYWVFLFYNSSRASLLFVLVSGTSGAVIGTVSGSKCVSAIFSYYTGLGAGIIDSTAAASAVSSEDSAYIHENPSASAFYFLISGASYAGLYHVGPMWDIHFTTCSPNGGGTGSNFTAEVNATNGHVVASNTSSGPCSSSPFRPQGSAEGDTSGLPLSTFVRLLCCPENS